MEREDASRSSSQNHLPLSSPSGIVLRGFGTRKRLQVDEAAETPSSSSIDRQLRCLPNLERPMHRGQNLALFSKPLMKIRNFLALFRK
ncbi:MAG: hypothetical protein DMG97_07200 [Acidobacteria bacterium]|nr:MAG: hypothetical protein DMG97_07200 [Acidobacteriota bacterium]